MKRIFFFLVSAFYCMFGQTQNLPLVASFYMPDKSGITVTDVIPTHDSAYVFLCYNGTEFPAPGPNNQMILLKIDETFNLLWSKKYSSVPGTFHFMKIIECEDSSLVISGEDSLSNTCLFRLNKDGEIIWAKNFTSENAFRNNVVESKDHHLIVLSHGNDEKSPLSPTGTSIVKFSEDGNLIWGKKIGGYSLFAANGLATTTDNKIVVAGNANTTGYTDEWKPILLSLDTNGTQEWSKQLNSPNNIKINSINIKDSAIIIQTTYGLICTDLQGNITWAKNSFLSETTCNSFLPPKIKKESDGGFVYNNLDFNVIKTDQEGNPVFTKEIRMVLAGTTEDFHHGHLVYGNGPILPADSPLPSDEFGFRCAIYRIDSVGQTPPCVTASIMPNSPSILDSEQSNLTISDYTPVMTDVTVTSEEIQVGIIYNCINSVAVEEINNVLLLSIVPNPVVDQAVIRVDNLQNSKLLRVYDYMGRIVHENTFTGNEYLFNRRSCKSGVYLLTITDDSGNAISTKMIIH